MPSGMTSFAERTRDFIAAKFDVYGRGSTISTEIFAGVTTYLSLSFVFILNPTILGAAAPDAHGVAMSPASILLATIITSAGATIAMGWFANLPLAVGPGIEVSAFFTYILVRQMGLSWEAALMAVALSGAINLFLTALSLRRMILEAIPQGLKSALLLTIGAFVFLVGLKLGDIVDVDTHTSLLFMNTKFWSISNLERGPLVLLIGLGVCFIVNWRHFKLPWGTLVGIIAGAIACYFLGVHATVHHGTNQESWTQTFFKLELPPMAKILPFVSGIVILFVVDFVGGISKIYALTEETKIPTMSDKVPGLKNALFVDGAATVLGGALGTSSLIAFVESRVGIEAGGQTGIMAIVCGLLMIAGGMFSGLLVLVPPAAAAGVLVYVGAWLIGLNLRSLKRHDLSRVDYVIAAIMVTCVLLTFQMDYAMLFGFGPYFVIALRRGVPLKSAFWLGLVALALLVTIIPDYVAIQDFARGFPGEHPSGPRH